MPRWITKRLEAPVDHVALAIVIAFFCAVGAPHAVSYFQLAAIPEIAHFAWRLHRNPLNAHWTLLMFVVAEDLIFRAAPIAWACRYLKPGAVLFVAGLASIVFGFGPHYFLPISVKVGVTLGGMVLSLIYLKCGGWRKNVFWTPFGFVVGAHLLFDRLLFAHLLR